MKLQFAEGNPRLTFSQLMVATAIEYWLNETVLKEPCEVVSMTETKVNRTSTFEVILAESQTAGVEE